MRALVRAGLVLLLAALGCGKRPVSVVPADLPVDWQPFRWVELTIGTVPVSRAAVLVGSTDRALRYESDGAAAAGAGGSGAPINQLHLDFGFSATDAFGIPLLTADSLPTDPRTPTLFRATVRSLGRRGDTLGVAPRLRLGTVGLLFYGVRGLLIDQVEHRIGTLRGTATLPASLTDRMAWADAKEAVGRLEVSIADARGPLGALWYDPGSSLVPLLVDGATWARLSGRSPDDRGTRRLVFPVGGDSVVLVGAPTARPFALGAIPLGTVTVWRVGSAPAGSRPDRFPDGVVGTIGNPLFEDARMIYVDVRRGRLGVIR